MKLNNQLGKKGRWVEAMRKAKVIFLSAEQTKNNFSTKLTINESWRNNLTFLWNIESSTFSKDEKIDKAIQLSPTQLQKLRKDNLDQSFDRLDAEDAINDARSQLQFLKATITQAENGLDLTPETLAGFGHTLEDISNKLKPDHFRCDN